MYAYFVENLAGCGEFRIAVVRNSLAVILLRKSVRAFTFTAGYFSHGYEFLVSCSAV